MGIKNLPRASSKFKASLGPGSFARKFKSSVKYGGLKNLGDNVSAITNAIKKRERIIKRGGLSRLQRLSAWNEIKKSDKSLTKEDNRDIKKILEHLGSKRGQIEADGGTQKKESKGIFSGIFGGSKKEESSNKKVSPYLMQKAGKDGQETRYAGGSVFTRQKFAGREAILGQAGGGVHGSAGNLGVKRGQVGFAKSAPKSSGNVPSSPPSRLSGGAGGRPVIPLSK